MIRTRCLRSWAGILLALSVSTPTFGYPGSPGRTGGDRWGANYFPNVPLVTHEGKTVRFFDDLLKDKVVVINFIYTSCPDVCPMETAKLAELEGLLGDRVGRDVFFYSITIDPDVDTPEVLNEYAKMYQAGPGWSFLTGQEEDITLLRKKLGLYIEEIQDEDSSDHNLSFVIGNQSTGRWTTISPFENPSFLASQVGTWLHNWKNPGSNQDSYANAPKLRKTSSGETLFRTRCATCHVIGGGENASSQSARLLGPDLLHVTQRRDPAWLSRWIKEPDKMLAEHDPLALALRAQYGDVPMPNMNLTDVDVVALIEYLETESQRIEKVQQFARVQAASQEGEGPASCCQKNKGAASQDSDASAQVVSVGEVAESAGAEEERKSVLLGPTGKAAGLGFVFLLLAAVSRRLVRADAQQE